MKRKILFVGHGTVERNSGGVEVYQRLLAQELDEQFKFLFFAPDLHGLLKNAYVLYDLNGVIHDRQVIDPPVLQDHLNHPVLEAYLRKIVIDHGIGIVHFHHLLRQVPSLIGILAEMGVPSLVTLHDYYSVCDRHTLLNQHDEYCDIFGKPQVDCDTCLFQMTGIQAGSQSVRRFAYEAALMKAEKLIFNTLGVAENHKKILKNIDARRFVVVGAPSKTVFRSQFRGVLLVRSRFWFQTD